MIYGNQSLLLYNTFHIAADCSYFSEIRSEDEFIALQKEPLYQSNEKLIVGGGSNLLFTKDFNGLVIRNSISGREVVKEDEQYVWVKAGAGEVWHDFVLWCIAHNYGGLENLSLIPGRVGASPMQNIGAYGVEIKDVFEELEALDMKSGEKTVFTKEACEFGYRESVFKGKFKNKYLITSVTFKLSKHPVFNTTYGAIEKELEVMGVKELSIKAISDAVIRIRSSKLPDPAEIGNAGSFFKNPEIPAVQYEKLKEEFPAVVAYPLANGNVKLAAGWLIEQAGWKGYRKGDAGVHKKQALVLVNYDKAKGNEIYALSTEVLESVKAKFGVYLEREVNIC
ncbi:MAG: UDP-N-acetylenolpyruvoylglucosamine reductase [Bacteroidetes bacterium]|jgi:UDP-N-acetylmuramate dehydrogenase|nr:UDP-N-acetylenolpyruvoylglucosamine reductase [Bacteroidota bacterium]